jgi:hypothetical protein
VTFAIGFLHCHLLNRSSCLNPFNRFLAKHSYNDRTYCNSLLQLSRTQSCDFEHNLAMTFEILEKLPLILGFATARAQQRIEQRGKIVKK